MRVITANLNGIRSAWRKGFCEWLIQQNADCICLQELKAQPEDLAGPEFALEGYHRFLNCADKKGYSGVAVYTRCPPLSVACSADKQDPTLNGRYLAVHYPGLVILCLYLPSGSYAATGQQAKFAAMDLLLPHFQALKGAGEVLLCGDFNIAHRAIDLKNWRANQKNSGFLPEERAWLDRLLTEEGYVDVFRALYPELEQYTWWSQRGQAYANNVGWRIDYQIATPALASRARAASICRDPRFSDHAPLMVDYDFMI